MKPIVYFFGSLPKGFSAYPQDHTQAFFEAFLKRSQNTLQIVVHRSDNLLYYGYVRKFSDSHYFGIGLCVDVICCDVRHLFDVFDDVYARMIEQGDILRIGPKADIEWAIKNYASESVGLNEYSREIIGRLNLSADNTRPLPPPDFSVAISDCLDISLETSSDADIIEATERYANLYIVNTDAEIEKVSAFIRVVKEKNEEIERLKRELGKKKNKPKGKRNIFLWIAAAGLLLLAGGAAAFLAWKEYTDLAPASYSDSEEENLLTTEEGVEIKVKNRQTAASFLTREAKAEIKDVRQTHDIEQGGLEGLRIEVEVNAFNMQDDNIKTAISLFESDNNTLLQKADGSNMIYSSGSYRVPHEATTLTYIIFIPYATLDSSSESDGNLSFDITVYDNTNNMLDKIINNRFPYNNS